MVWYGYAGSVFETGEIFKANDKDELQFSFGKAGNVHIKTYQEENENLVELTQEGIPQMNSEKQVFPWAAMQAGFFTLPI